MEIALSNFGAIERKLARLSNADFTELHNRIGTRLIGWLSQNVEAEGLESKWPPLRPNTLYARRQSGGGKGGRGLRDTGGMVGAMYAFGVKATADHVTVGFPQTGGRPPLAVFHHFGTKRHPIEARNRLMLAFPSMWTRAGATRALGAAYIATALKEGTRLNFASPIRNPKSLWLSKKAMMQKGAMKHMTTFQAGGRGLKDFGSLNFMVIRKVMHPGTPPRRLLPSKQLARSIAVDVATQYYQELLAQEGAL